MFHGTELVATHARSREPHARIVDPAHFAGLWKRIDAEERSPAPDQSLAELGRSLNDYADVIAAEAS